MVVAAFPRIDESRKSKGEIRWMDQLLSCTFRTCGRSRQIRRKSTICSASPATCRALCIANDHSAAAAGHSPRAFGDGSHLNEEGASLVKFFRRVFLTRTGFHH